MCQIVQFTYLLFGFFINFVTSFTRDFRIFEFSKSENDEHMFAIDPTLYGFDDSLKLHESLKYLDITESSKNKAELNSAIDSFLDSGIRMFFKYETEEYAWLSTCDISTIDEINVLLGKVRMWRRILDGSASNVTVVDLQNILKNMVTFDNNSGFRTVEVAATLALQQNPELSAMILFPQISYFIQSGWTSDMDSLILALNLQAENYRQMGHLDQASLSLLKVIMLLDSDGLRPLQAGNQVRLLLLLPLLPVDTATALQQRSFMIEDLLIFTEILKQNDISLNLQMLNMILTSTPFHAAHQGLNDLKFQQTVVAAFSQLCPELNYVAPRLVRSTANQSKIEPLAGSVEKIKVGFVSSHLHQHSIGKILHESICSLESDEVEVTVFLLNRGHQHVADEITEHFEACLGEISFVRLPIDLVQAREIVGSDAYDLDALIFTDVGMDIASVLLVHSRLAPIQIAWWGHPVTTGSPAIDFYFGLDVEVQEAAITQYSEQLVRMSYINTSPTKHHIKTLTAPITGATTKVTDFPSLTDLGLLPGSQHAMVLGQLFKLHPSFDDALFQLLMGTTEDVFVVLIREKIASVNHMLHRRWYGLQEELCCAESVATSAVDSNDTFPSCCGNVNLYMKMHRRRHNALLGSGGPVESMYPKEYKLNEDLDDDSLYERFGRSVAAGTTSKAFVMHRLRFISYKHYDASLLNARVVLDTFPYGGCLSSHDALANSIPIVTFPSEYSSGRCLLGLYHQMKYTSLLAENATHYVQIATRLLTDDSFLQEQKQAILDRFQSSFHKNDEVAREWGDFLLTVISSLQVN